MNLDKKLPIHFLSTIIWTYVMPSLIHPLFKLSHPNASNISLCKEVFSYLLSMSKSFFIFTHSITAAASHSTEQFCLKKGYFTLEEKWSWDQLTESYDGLIELTAINHVKWVKYTLPIIKP